MEKLVHLADFGILNNFLHAENNVFEEVVMFCSLYLAVDDLQP